MGRKFFNYNNNIIKNKYNFEYLQIQTDKLNESSNKCPIYCLIIFLENISWNVNKKQTKIIMEKNIYILTRNYSRDIFF